LHFSVDEIKELARDSGDGHFLQNTETILEKARDELRSRIKRRQRYNATMREVLEIKEQGGTQ